MRRIAFNTEMPAGQAPEWVELIPAGPEVRGIDGRAWAFGPDDAARVVAAYNRRGLPVQIDWEHATEHRAPKGLEAPAAGWITGLEIRGGAVWGRVEWTPRAANQIATREYRYLSPVFYHTQSVPSHVAELVSAGLTNHPNLRLKALNAQAAEPEDEMKLPKALCALLGVAEDATEEQINQQAGAVQAALDKAKNTPEVPAGVAAALDLPAGSTADQAAAKAQALAKAANQQQPGGLDKYVPRTDLDHALTRAANAEERLRTIEAARREADIEAAVTQAIAGGKIAPASQGYYRAMCAAEGGLEEFKKFMATAPQVIKDPELPGKPGDADPKALNAQQAQIAEMFGNTPEDLAKYAG
jgi:phage I-like protein